MADDTLWRIRERLAEYYDASEVALWLNSPQPLLDGKIAIDLINSGQSKEVERLIDLLDSGAFI